MSNTATVQEEHLEGIIILKIGGRLDALSSQPVEKEVLSAIEGSERRVLLNFSEVTYLSSAGMRMLLATFKRVKTASGRLGLCSVDSGVLDILKMSGFDEFIDVYPNQDEAVKGMQEHIWST